MNFIFLGVKEFITNWKYYGEYRLNAHWHRSPCATLILHMEIG